MCINTSKKPDTHKKIYKGIRVILSNVRGSLYECACIGDFNS